MIYFAEYYGRYYGRNVVKTDAPEEVSDVELQAAKSEFIKLLSVNV